MSDDEIANSLSDFQKAAVMADGFPWRSLDSYWSLRDLGIYNKIEGFGLPTFTPRGIAIRERLLSPSTEPHP